MRSRRQRVADVEEVQERAVLGSIPADEFMGRWHLSPPDRYKGLECHVPDWLPRPLRKFIGAQDDPDYDHRPLNFFDLCWFVTADAVISRAIDFPAGSRCPRCRTANRSTSAGRFFPADAGAQTRRGSRQLTFRPWRARTRVHQAHELVSVKGKRRAGRRFFRAPVEPSFSAKASQSAHRDQHLEAETRPRLTTVAPDGLRRRSRRCR